MNLKNVRKLNLVVIMMLLVSAFFQTNIPSLYANTEEADFTVQAVLPENQVNQNVSYFDLLMEPGDEQTLEVVLTNKTDKPVDVQVEAITASTNRNGIIDYSTPNISDETMEVVFSEIANVLTPNLTIDPLSSTTAQVEITMPKEEYDGIVLGGIVVTGDPEDGQGEGTSIVNQFSYVIGTQLTETDKTVNPDFELASVSPDVVDFLPALVAELRNTNSQIVKDATVSVELYRGSNQNTLIAEYNKGNIDVAPNSIFPLTLYLENGELTAGKYSGRILLEHEGEEWEFEFGFEISEDEAKSLEDNSIITYPEETDSQMVLYVIIGILILVILIFILFFILFKRRKEEEEEEIEIIEEDLIENEE